MDRKLTPGSPYDELAQAYDSPVNQAFYGAIADCLGAWVPEAGSHPERPRALDLACGTGTSLEALSARFPGYAWEGVDASARMIERARARPALESLALQVARAEALPHPDQSLELISSSFALHWFGPAAWSEVWRVLKPGGWFVGSVPLRGRRPAHPGNEALFRALLARRRQARSGAGAGLSEGQLRERLEGWSEVSFQALELEESFPGLAEMNRILTTRGSVQAIFGLPALPPETRAPEGELTFVWKIGFFRAQKPS